MSDQPIVPSKHDTAPIHGSGMSTYMIYEHLKAINGEMTDDDARICAECEQSRNIVKRDGKKYKSCRSFNMPIKFAIKLCKKHPCSDVRNAGHATIVSEQDVAKHPR